MGIAKEICRIEKIKSVGALGGAYQHNLRLKDIPNTNETKTNFNIELTDRPQGKSYADCFHEKISASPWYQNGNHQIAKNAIYAVEFMLTFGNEAADQIDIENWCRDNLDWLHAHFGGSANVISAVLHLDERTPHIHAIVIPMDEKGKLNYTKYLGGSKHRLSELQDSYHEEVGQIHRLDRGMKGSKASHQDIDNFYSMVNETVTVQNLPEPEPREGLFKKGETAKDYQQRIAPLVQYAQAAAIAKEKENELLKQRLSSIEHLQEGVVPLDVHQSMEKELSDTRNQLECKRRELQFYKDWALESQKKHDELQQGLSARITVAVKSATESLQNLYGSLLDKYNYMKQKFENLTFEHTNLTADYKKLKREYDNLLYNSQHVEELNNDRKLMYAMLDNRGFASVFDRYREARLNGKSSIGERMEIEKYRSRHFSGLAKSNGLVHSDNKSHLTR